MTSIHSSTDTGLGLHYSSSRPPSPGPVKSVYSKLSQLSILAYQELVSVCNLHCLLLICSDFNSLCHLASLQSTSLAIGKWEVHGELRKELWAAVAFHFKRLSPSLQPLLKPIHKSEIQLDRYNSSSSISIVQLH